MRCFIGIPLPEKTKEPLVKAQECFKKVDSRMTLVKPENMHVTLCFLGNIEDTDKVIESLSELKMASFKATIKGLSFFTYSFMNVQISIRSNGTAKVPYTFKWRKKNDFKAPKIAQAAKRIIIIPLVSGFWSFDFFKRKINTPAQNKVNETKEDGVKGIMKVIKTITGINARDSHFLFVFKAK